VCEKSDTFFGKNPQGCAPGVHFVRLLTQNQVWLYSLPRTKSVLYGEGEDEAMTNPVDIEVYYNTHLPTAQALPASSILATRVDYDLAIVNVETGMHVVIEHASEIPVHFPKVNLVALKALSEIALATKYAALRAEQEVPAENAHGGKIIRSEDLAGKASDGSESARGKRLDSARRGGGHCSR
jgi:hypothetical protein